jgi:hypothetical protein
MKIQPLCRSAWAGFQRVPLLWQIVLAALILMTAAVLAWDWMQEREVARNAAWNRRNETGWTTQCQTPALRLRPLENQ